MRAADAPQSSTQELIEKFRHFITNQKLERGSRLPPERELAISLGTSRASLRQALKALESVGVITQRVGDGTYLSTDANNIMRIPLSFVMLLDGISLLELFDLRLMIEPEMAAKAAERATGRDLDAIRLSLNQMPHDTARADAQFHEAICRATGNRLWYRIYQAIQAVFRQAMEITTKLAPPEHALGFHKQIYAAIHSREPEQARDRMRAHLMDARSILLTSYWDDHRRPADSPG